jgi:hypothetical protein
MGVMFCGIDVEMVRLFKLTLGWRLVSNGCETIAVKERILTSRSLCCIAFEDVG